MNSMSDFMKFVRGVCVRVHKHVTAQLKFPGSGTSQANLFSLAKIVLAEEYTSYPRSSPASLNITCPILNGTRDSRTSDRVLLNLLELHSLCACTFAILGNTHSHASPSHSGTLNRLNLSTKDKFIALDWSLLLNSSS